MLRKGKINAGDLVITSEQTEGKGQRGNSWEAEPHQNLTFSLILKPGFLMASEQFNLNMAVSTGIVDYLKTINKHFQTKWPNDIYHEEKKLGGILIQNNLKGQFLDFSIIGVGLNINQKNFISPKATSLSLLEKTEFSLTEVLAQICLSIEARYLQLKKGNIKSLKNAYLNNLLGLNEKRLFKSDKTFEGTIIDISPQGKLIIATDSGNNEFDLKEVTFL